MTNVARNPDTGAIVGEVWPIGDDRSEACFMGAARFVGEHDEAQRWLVSKLSEYDLLDPETCHACGEHSDDHRDGTCPL